MKAVWGKKKMYIREELLNTVFGYRKASFTDWIDSHPKYSLNKTLKRLMRISGAIWQEVVKVLKRKVVILTPTVLISNVISNFMLSVTMGMPIGYTLKHQVSGIAALNNYQKQVKERDELARIIKIAPTAANIQNRKLKLERLDTAIKNNPVSRLIDKGMFQSIVEDIDLGDMGKEGGILTMATGLLPEAARKASRKGIRSFSDVADTNKKVGFVINTYKHLVLSEDTRVGQLLTEATQYSDFVARYAMHKYLTEEKGVSDQEASETVLDVFIDYEVNTSPQIQWLNDMGLLMYTKFLFRIQRIIVRQLAKNPARSVSMELVQQATIDIPDITDSFLPMNLSLSRTNDPWEVVSGASELSLLNYVPFL